MMFPLLKYYLNDVLFDKLISESNRMIEFALLLAIISSWLLSFDKNITNYPKIYMLVNFHNDINLIILLYFYKLN